MSWHKQSNAAERRRPRLVSSDVRRCDEASFRACHLLCTRPAQQGGNLSDAGIPAKAERGELQSRCFHGKQQKITDSSSRELLLKYLGGHRPSRKMSGSLFCGGSQGLIP